jgi:hypothetical protein
MALYLCSNLFFFGPLHLLFELQFLFYDLPMFSNLDPILVLQIVFGLHNLYELQTTTLKLVFCFLTHISPFFVLNLQFVIHSHLQFVDVQFALHSHL